MNLIIINEFIFSNMEINIVFLSKTKSRIQPIFYSSRLVSFQIFCILAINENEK